MECRSRFAELARISLSKIAKVGSDIGMQIDLPIRCGRLQLVGDAGTVLFDLLLDHDGSTAVDEVF